MFYVDESKNLNSALWQSCWRHGVSRTLKISFSYFFCFWLGFLFCRLLWNGFGELVSVMERNPSCSRIFFMSSVKHSSRRGLVQRFQGSERRWRGERYMKLAEDKESRLLARRRS
jgi:hypothetical protein